VSAFSGAIAMKGLGARRSILSAVMGVTCAVLVTIQGLYAQIQYFQGQNVAPVFEGWERNEDASFNFVFGYMNRNYEETLNIPIGPDNNIQPGGPDRGQPTHFDPRRTLRLFKVTVPKGWDRNERLVWSLTAHGRTDVAKAWLQPEWEIENGSKTRDGEANAAPVITGSGPQRVTWPARTVQLTAAASDDGLPKPTRRPPTSGRRPSPEGCTARSKASEPVMWSKLCIDGSVFVAAVAPVLGVIMAIYMSAPA